MEVKAIGKFIKVQPRKVRIVADEIRGKDAVHSAALLRYHTSKGARELRKVLISAMANALENHSMNPESLKIAKIMVDEGPRMKRLRARAQGRGNRIIKKTSHITVIVEEDLTKGTVIKAHGTKAKPRPTFAAPKKGKAKASSKAAGSKEQEVETTTEAIASVETVETAAAEPVVEATQEVAAEQTTAAAEEASAESEATEEQAEETKEDKGEESN